MNRRYFCYIAFFLLFVSQNIIAQGFLRADGKRIVDGNGNEVILRGHSPGGWMLQEGYMLQTNAFANAQYQIRAKIEDVIGAEQTDVFYDLWYQNHFTKADLELMASMGFNSIRLPMHYNLFTLPIELEPVEGENTWLERGFEMVDSLLAWCSEKEMYLILDMHAAPGGQGKDAAISDYDPSKPSLWESELNKDKLVALWRKLAERYADEPWMGGYDLINEPNWAFTGSNINGCNENTNAPLRELYIRMTDAIREVDQNHIIFIEGNCWGNNHNGLTPPWDDNLVYSFHKYWSTNDQASIQFALNIRNNHNVPIWCGEAGENSNHWFAEAVKLLEENNIGWAWWTWKKFGSESGIANIHPPSGYETLKTYWQHGGPKPTQEFATGVMMELAERLKLENCSINYDVADALLRQPSTDTLKPFREHTAPGIIYAVDYDMGRNGFAYNDAEFQNTHISSGSYTAWNIGWSYRNDGVDIEICNDTDHSTGFNVGWTSPGEWMKYTFTVEENAAYTFTLRHAGNNAVTRMRFQVNDLDVVPVVTVNSTGGWQSWRSYTIPGVVLDKGRHVLKVSTLAGGTNLNYFEFSDPVELSEAPFRHLVAESSVDGSFIRLILNKEISPSINLLLDEFTVRKGADYIAIDSISVDNDEPRVLIINLSDRIYYGDVIRINYGGTSVKDVYERELEPFQNLDVVNNTPLRHNLPGLVRVTDYYYQEGLAFENTTDVGGGQNFGYTNNGDFIDFLVRINQAGTYEFNYRIAAMAGNGRFQVQLFDEEGTRTDLAAYSVPATGGWQTWRTINSEISLPAGAYKLRIYIVSREFNMNWFSVTNLITGLRNDVADEYMNIYPNPAGDFVLLTFQQPVENARIEIFNAAGKRVWSDSGAMGEMQEHRIDLKFFPEGIYVMRTISRDAILSRKFIISR
jgi:endoglucanase